MILWPSVESIVCVLHGEPTTETHTLSLHDALPIWHPARDGRGICGRRLRAGLGLVLVLVVGPSKARGEDAHGEGQARSEEHTSELQSQSNLVCRLLLEKKKNMRLLLIGLPICRPRP